MQPTGCGRHCAACEKTVVDFTGFSDELLLTYFQRNAGKEICGRILASQANRPLVTAKSRTGWGWYAKIAATLLAIQASAVTAFAQKAKRPAITVKAGADTSAAKHTDTVIEVRTWRPPYNVQYRPVENATMIGSLATPVFQPSKRKGLNIGGGRASGTKYIIDDTPCEPDTPPSTRPSFLKRIKHWFKK